MRETQTHAAVREGYARVAKKKTSCCGPAGCGAEIETAKQIGYSDADLAGPAAAGNLGLGCGNPTAIANLQPGEVVVDLGSGAGFDALLAAGHEPHVLVRPGSEDKLHKADQCSITTGDLDSTEAVDAVVAGCDAVIYNVGILREFPRQGITFEALQYRGASEAPPTDQSPSSRVRTELDPVGVGMQKHCSGKQIGAKARHRTLGRTGCQLLDQQQLQRGLAGEQLKPVPP